MKELGGKLAPNLAQPMNAVGAPPQALDRWPRSPTKWRDEQRDRLIEVAKLGQQAAPMPRT